MSKFTSVLFLLLLSPSSWAENNLLFGIKQCSIPFIQLAIRFKENPHLEANRVYHNAIQYSDACVRSGLPATTVVHYFHSLNVKAEGPLDPLPEIVANPKIPASWIPVAAHIGSDFNRLIYSPRHSLIASLSLLHLAILENSPEKVRTLLEFGAKVDTLSSLGESPLLFAVWFYFNKKRVDQHYSSTIIQQIAIDQTSFINFNQHTARSLKEAFIQQGVLTKLQERIQLNHQILSQAKDKARVFQNRSYDIIETLLEFDADRNEESVLNLVRSNSPSQLNALFKVLP